MKFCKLLTPLRTASESTRRLRRGRWLLLAIWLLGVFMSPATAAAAGIKQYVGPPPSYFCCYFYGGSTPGYAYRDWNKIYWAGTGHPGLVYDGASWVEGYVNPFIDNRNSGYARAACANLSTNGYLSSVTCFTKSF